MKTRIRLLVSSGLTLCAALWAMPPTASAQNIFVANQGNGTVSEFSSSGTLINATFVSGLSEISPYGLAFDSSGDLFVANVNVANVNAGMVSEYNSSGTLINATFASSGLRFPEGLAFDSSGDLYVANNGFGEISEFNSSGTLLTSLRDLGNPSDFAFDSSGNLVVVFDDTVSERSLEFTIGNFVIAALAIDSSGDLFLSGRNGAVSEVSVFSSSRTLLNASFAPGVNEPDGLAFDSNGDLYVVNSGNNTISEFNSSGTLINTISNPSLDDPTFIAISPVPEPSTCALLAAGATALWLRRRRK